MRLSVDEIIGELKQLIDGEKSPKRKYLIKQALEILKQLEQKN
jgi:hypothetical protein